MQFSSGWRESFWNIQKFSGDELPSNGASHPLRDPTCLSCPLFCQTPSQHISHAQFPLQSRRKAAPVRRKDLFIHLLAPAERLHVHWEQRLCRSSLFPRVVYDILSGACAESLAWLLYVPQCAQLQMFLVVSSAAGRWPELRFVSAKMHENCVIIHFITSSVQNVRTSVQP